jgi:hypothetical protein
MCWSRCSNGAAATLDAKAEGRRRAQTGWEDGVNSDIKALREINWRNLATNKQIWHNLLRKLWLKWAVFPVMTKMKLFIT